MTRFELLRYERGLTITDLASRTGVAVGTLRRLEGEGNAKPSAPVAKALADFYKISVPDLLGLEAKEAA